MAFPAKKVSLSMVVVILLLFSAASFSVYARSRSYGKIHTRGDREHETNNVKNYFHVRSIWDKRKYQIYFVLLLKHPNGDDKEDARRRWYESFLPSTLTDSGEPRLLHCYTFHINGFLARMTRDEASVLANKPGLKSIFSDDLGPYHYSRASCGIETTASTKRSFVRSRPAF